MEFIKAIMEFVFLKFICVKKYNYLLSVLFIICVCSTSICAMEWPVLDSADPQKPRHKKIIGSIFGRPGEEYCGGKFKENVFVVQGHGVDQQQNCELIRHLPCLRELLQQGHEIKLFHVGTTDEVAHFSRHVLYQIALNDHVLSFRFSLYNKGKLNHFTPFIISNQEHTLLSLPMLPFYSSQHIARLMEEHTDHHVLKHAFAIMAGADLAIAHDQKILLNTIQAYPNDTINMESLVGVMSRDRDLITQAACAFSPEEGSKGRHYLPFLDQLHTLGNQGALCGHRYKGRKGIDEAILYIRNNPALLRGILSDNLQQLKGKNSINLRISLFYIALEKKKSVGEIFELTDLTTFYKGEYFGPNQCVKDLLSQTSFHQNGSFYTPSNGYVKNGDSSITVPNRNLNNLQMVFTDCSGFAQYVVRQFHPTNQRLKTRIMSYHLAALYDFLANEEQGTTNILYDLNGNNSRSLKEHEIEKITGHSETIRQLKSVYEPVLNPLQNIKSGDLLVERSADFSREGHVMIVVEQDLNNPSHVTIVELTSGSIRGYTWRDLNLSNNTEDRFHRVLRIKNQQ